MRFQRILGTTLSIFALASLAACYGDDGADGKNGTNGANGSNGANGISAVLKITAEAAGSYCANGGSRIESGPDTNGNGTLEAGEVTGTQYVCNGSTPVRTLTATAVEASGANCATGGTRITAGADANGNGTLEAAEVSSTAYVCNGATGATGSTGSTGATGATGANGLTQLLALAVEPVGSANCTYGGTRITSGLDTNRDGALAAGEVTATSYVCNGSGVNWTNVVSDTNVQMASHMGYIASNTSAEVAFALPVAPAVADIVRVKGGLGAGWKITQTAGQSVDLSSLRTWSSLSGQSWSAQPVQIGVTWETWVASSTDGRTVAALSSWSTAMALSKDGGSTWAAITPPGTDLRRIGISPNGQVIYASHFGAIGFNVSSDDGATWVQRNTMTDVLDFSVYTNGVVAVGTVGGVVGPHRSTDGGATWTSLLPAGAPAGACWSTIAVSNDGQTIAIGGDGNGSCSAISTYVSQDAGVSWVASDDAAGGPPRNRQQYVAVSGSGNTVVVGSSNGGIGLRVSTDGGRSYRYSAVAGGLFPVLSGRVILSADGRRMMAPGEGRVYVSNNSGYNWSFTSPALGVQALAGSSTLESVYLSTPRGSNSGKVFKSSSVLSTYSGTTTGVNGQVSGASGDALELQYLGSGVWSVLSGVGNTLVVR